MARVICLLNGITDVPLEDLGGLTPLQKASHPTLDGLARQGNCLQLAVPEIGGWSVSLLSLLGVSEGLERVSKAALEALALGYRLGPHQEAYCVRFVSAGEGVVVDLSDDLVTDNEGKLLCDALNARFGKQGYHFLAQSGPRAVLVSERKVLDEGGVAPTLSPTDMAGKTWRELLPDPSLEELIEGSMQVLAEHEVNRLKEELEEPPVTSLVLSEGGGELPWRESQNDSDRLLYTTWSASMGAAISMGMPLYQLLPETHKYDHLRTLLASLEELVSRSSTLILDLSYLWESTFRGDLLEKVKSIEWLDRYWVDPLAQFCETKGHSLSILPLRNCDIRSGSLTSGSVPLVTLGGDQTGIQLERYEEPLFADAPRLDRF